MLLMSIHSICLFGVIREIFTQCPFLSGVMAYSGTFALLTLRFIVMIEYVIFF